MKTLTAIAISLLAAISVLAHADQHSGVVPHSHPTSDNMCGSHDYGECTNEKQWVAGYYAYLCHASSPLCIQRHIDTGRSEPGVPSVNVHEQRTDTIKDSPGYKPTPYTGADDGNASTCYQITVKVEAIVGTTNTFTLVRRCVSPDRYLEYKAAGGRKQFDD